MVPEPSGPGDDVDTRWSDSSTADPDSGSAGDASQTDRREHADDADHRIPLHLSTGDDGDAEPAAETDEYLPEANSTPIEPGTPDLENALFVLLGALAMVLVIARLLMLPLG